MLTIGDLPDPGSSHGKILKRFELRFSVHHKKLVKTYENQFIITKKFHPIFREKMSPWITVVTILSVEVISKLIGVKFRKSTGNIKYSAFPPG